jgi:hypothetical protein
MLRRHPTPFPPPLCPPAPERLSNLAGSGFSELGKTIVTWLANQRSAAAAKATTSNSSAPSLIAAGRRLMSAGPGEEGEAAEALASIKDSLATITSSTR